MKGVETGESTAQDTKDKAENEKGAKVLKEVGNIVVLVLGPTGLAKSWILVSS